MSFFVKQLAVKVIRACQLEDPGKSETNRRVCTNLMQGSLIADNAFKKEASSRNGDMESPQSRERTSVLWNLRGCYSWESGLSLSMDGQ